VLALTLAFVCLPLLKNKLKNTNEYFGIAENQVRNVNLEYPIEILTIKKQQGESVSKGDTILKFRILSMTNYKSKRKLTQIKKTIPEILDILTTR
jgi:hypothetical protein